MRISIILLIILYNVFPLAAQNDTTETFTILTNGGPPNNKYRNAENVVTERWGIIYKITVSGCSVSESLADSMKIHNEKIYPLIAQKYGIDWRTKLSDEIQEEIKIQEKVLELIKKEPYIQEKTTTEKYLDYIFDKKDEGTYRIYVWGFAEWKGKSQPVYFFELLANINKNQVKLISDIIKPLE